MNQLTTPNVLLLLLGLVFQILLTIEKVLKNPHIQFSIPRWLQENWVNAAISLTAAVASLMMADNLVRMLQLNPDADSMFYSCHAFLSGYMGREIIFRALKVMKNRK